MYWVPHDSAVWLPGKCLSGTPGGKGSYSTDQGQVNVTLDKVDPISDEWDLKGVNDVCILKEVSDATLLHTLRVRYARDEIYTSISCILMAVNPFKALNIYSSEFMELYHTAHDKQALAPHIFQTGAYAFQRLVEKQSPQAVLISGESGAGKTENTKFVLLYLSEILRSEAGLEDKLLEINPILEAFGNAKTVRNDNSSRFGKWIEVLVNPAKLALAGASVTDYLLEITRVCSQGPGERNYHIFYQLTTTEARKMFPSLQLGEASAFNYLKANPAGVQSINDTAEFDALQEALSAMKFEPAEEESIFRIAAGVLHLGNLEFADQGDHLNIKNADVLGLVSTILACDKEKLEKCVRFKRIKTGNEVMESPLDASKAGLARDSIAKLIYSRLFKWLVMRCNLALSATLTDKTRKDAADIFYGVLDIAGFETFETNRLEQLQINLSNEKLAQFFNHSVFKTELAEYMAEGIPIMKIEYKDNADVLALIEGKGGLLLMLDDATTGVKQTDEQYTTKVIQAHEKHPNFTKPKFTKDAPLCFGIRHYAGDVMYTASGFLEKNVSTQPPEVLELMTGSELSVLREIAQDPQTNDPGSPGKAVAKKATVGASFRKSLQALMDKLGDAEAHFVRCIKPNKKKEPSNFDSVLVTDQLKISGVMETVKIRKAGYLMRPTCVEFLQRYLILVERKVRQEILAAAGSKKPSHPDPHTNTVKASTSLIQALPGGIGSEIKDLDIAVGKTKVFIKADLYRTLENVRRDAFLKPTLWIQAHWRGYRTRVIMKEVIECNRALIQCRAKAGHIDRSDVSALKDDVSRATVYEMSLAQMDALLDKAKRLPIKLPSLPLYIHARAAMAAQSNLARQMQDTSDSVDVPLMQALGARAAAYKMKGSLVTKVKVRCDTVQKQLRLRRVLQDSVYYDLLADSQRVTTTAREAGLDKPATWILSDGPPAWTAAEQRLQQLEKEEEEKIIAIEALNKRITELLSSIDLPTMQATLIQSMSYNMKGELVDKLTERCDTLKLQMPCRQELQKCITSPDSTTVLQVINKLKDMGLDVPTQWLLPDGPKLYAKALGFLSELEQGSKSKARLAADQERQAQDLKASSKKPELKSWMHDEDSDIIKTDREVYIQNLAKTLPLPVTQAALGAELSTQLKTRCETLQKQLPYRRKLQIAASSNKLEEVQKILMDSSAAGFDAADAWILPEGSRLHEVATKRCATLAEENNSRASIEADIIKRLAEMQSSLDTVGMIRLIAQATAFNVKNDVLEASRQRVQSLQQQSPIRLGLQNYDNLDDMKKAVNDARLSALDKPENWLLPDGHAIMSKAVEHLNRVDGVHAQMKKAMDQMNISDMHKAFLDADELGLSRELFKSEFEFYMNVQCDVAFVEKKVAELREAGGDGAEEKVSNLLDVVEDPDCFDSCKILTQLNILGVLESVRLRKEGYSIRPRCAEFFKRYLAIIPKKERSSLLKSAGSKSDWKVTPETDAVKGARSLVTALPNALKWGELKPADIAVGKTKVFIKTDFYKTLEGNWRLAVEPLATKLQSVWRGRALRKVMRDVGAVGKDLKKSMAEAGVIERPGVKALKNNIHCASLLENALTSMDALLERAINLPIKMTSLPLFVKGRASLAAQTHLAKQMESMKDKVDIPSLEVLVAQAKALQMKGKLVDETTDRLATLGNQVRLRRLLSSSASCSQKKVSNVQAIMKETRDAGLDAPDKWLLPDGHAAWGVASKTHAELEAAMKLSTDAKANINSNAQSSMESIDLPAMQALVYSARDLEIEGEAISKLKERTEIVEKQLPLFHELGSCIADASPEGVSAIVAKAKNEGLHEKKQWLVPDGPRVYARAELWLAQLLDDKMSDDTCKADLDNQLQDLLHSFDTPSMVAVASRVEAINADSSALPPIKERAAALKTQIPLCQALYKENIDPAGIQDVLQKVKSAGLVDSPEKWLLPSGPYMMEKASSAAAGKLKMDLFKSEMAQNFKETADFSRADLEWHMSDLLAMLSNSSVHALVGKELVDSSKARCGSLQAQLPHRQALQMCAVYDKLEDVQKIDSDVKTADLASEDKWLLPDGYKFLTMATSRLQRLQEEVQAMEGMVGEIEQQLQDLKSSLDLPAMHGALARAEHCNVKKDLVAVVKERCDMLQKQLPMRRELQNCAVLEDLPEVQKVIAAMKGAGLDSPDKWMLPDGPKLFERANARAESLKEMDEVKGRILNAASIYDAVELQAALSVANELGMAQSQYPEAHALFLKLQDGDFINSKEVELNKIEHDDDQRMILMNLELQKAVLGLKTDAHEMQNLAKEIVKTHNGRTSVFKGTMKIDLMGQKLFQDLSNFSRLRDPLTWGQAGLAEKGDEAGDPPTAQSMLQHSNDHILEPLTQVPPTLEQAALKNFKNLLRCMGDKPGAFTGDKMEPIIKAAKKEEALRDEVYVQLLKQLTGNPSAKSQANGWELLTAIIRAVLPSSEMCEFVRGFLEKAVNGDLPDPEEDFSKRERKKNVSKSFLAPDLSDARNKERSASRADFIKNSLPMLSRAALEVFKNEMYELHGE